MRFATAVDFRVSLEERLRQRASRTGLKLPRLRKQVVFERLITRLVGVAPGRYVVKGGYALDIRFGDRARATQDLDLAIVESHDAMIDDLAAASAEDIEDFFSFEIHRTSALDNLEGGAAARFHVRARLAGKTFENVRLDIGLDDFGTTVAEEVPGGDMLAFAGVTPVQMALLPLSQHLAEKIHAYSRIYEGSRRNTRVKDLVDIVLIAELSTLQASALVAAIDETFRSRGVRAVPEYLAQPPADWATTYRTLAEEVAIDPRIGEGFDVASTFLNPILAGNVGLDAAWSSEQRRWLAPVPTVGLGPN